ncbi:hypothetical protein [Nonomuraea sp. NPDC050643]|uniref:hypothetical protein n=1 Tax=Nonomuraea sp. NPDC050643 TaxID=3155660 RepID=UPI0033E8DB02
MAALPGPRFRVLGSRAGYVATALRDGTGLPVDPYDAVEVLDVIERAHGRATK